MSEFGKVLVILAKIIVGLIALAFLIGGGACVVISLFYNGTGDIMTMVGISLGIVLFSLWALSWATGIGKNKTPAPDSAKDAVNEPPADISQ